MPTTNRLRYVTVSFLSLGSPPSVAAMKQPFNKLRNNEKVKVKLSPVTDREDPLGL
jgi:hypothetical protein